MSSLPVLRSARAIAADIKLAHSVFALPFALLAAFMAAAPPEATIEWPRFGAQLVLVVIAMVLARTVAMLANRLIDRRLDADNPRTAGRALPSGRVSVATAVWVMVGCSLLFLATCVAFGVRDGNWWPAALGVPVLACIAAYGYFKRFTAACHLYLGAALAISPLAAAVAIDPAAIPSQPALWLLAVMVWLWVAGFDVIYALQDLDHDRTAGLRSIPVRLGAGGARIASAVLHAGSAAALVAIALIDPRFGWRFDLAVVAVIGLLVIEHATVARWGTSRIALSFFTLNGVISCGLGAAGILDVIG